TFRYCSAIRRPETTSQVRNTRYPELLHKLSRPALAPRIVFQRELQPLAVRRMIVVPKHQPAFGVRIREGLLAQRLEGASGGLLRVLVDAVGYLESVDVCLVFDVAAEAGAQRLSQELQHARDQKESGQGGPVVERAYLPWPPKSRHDPGAD